MSAAQQLNNRSVIVLGMHRSGTSAFTGLLALHGVELGPNLIGANASNESGHWEHLEIVKLHDAMLKAFGSRWDDVCLLPDGWWRSEIVTPFREQLRGILLRDFSKAKIWGLKDPRICRLLPLWRQLLAELSCQVLYVIVVRASQETARSLASRDGFSTGKSELLWLQHSLEAERETRGQPRELVTFDHFMEQPQEIIERLQRHMGVPWPRQPTQGEVAGFLDSGKRHHRACKNPMPESWSERTYQAIETGVCGDEAAMIRQLEPVWEWFKAADALYRPEIGSLKNALEESRKSKKKLLAKTEEIKELKSKLRSLEKKLPVKISRFLGL